jgi:hypothetical protein
MNLPTSTQADGRHAAIDHRRRDRGRAHGLAGAAGILRANVAMDEEARRFDVELLADVLADQRQCLAAPPTGAGRRFVPVLDARQVVRQCLAAGARAGRLYCRRYGRRFGLPPVQLQFGRGDVGFQGLLEEVAGFGVERFALDPVAHALEVRQFQGQGLDPL